ncbi:AraC family transcriptional regulator [Flavobacterium jejuense]|uniref:AraC family transcriptional regulator n=1 Tax=Flavobacterium jejuense TaxID=1544455 RepID=A0ABX0IM47_9FLAO|nr:helix-turn-helix domain-containing protein [Flavobacterium jejuense]NHN24788.1 AraC family transcriptional regulator [Flavobacterium jejuense]
MKLYIQNMVCLCCKMTVASELKKMDLNYYNLELGEVSLVKPIKKKERTHLKNVLHEYGLELMDDKKAILVEKIVTIIVNMIHNSDEVPPVNFSIFLTNKLNQDYHSLSNLFSKTKGITIEHFIILHKIERVKELIMYDELSLTKISYQLHYSSVAHLSNQFKKITGLTPTFFKNIKNKKRKPLENLQ